MYENKHLGTQAHRFAQAYGGRVTFPGSADYDAERTAWNRAADQRPAAVAHPTGAADVRRVVRAAREAGLAVTTQATGHNAGPLGPLGGAVLVRTRGLQELLVDPVARTARVGAGVLWEQVVEAARPYGLTALHGSSPDVGVVGYLLGGGLSWYARKHGLAANHVRSIDVVLADGSFVVADREHNRELFWALRGAGGSFGVVTAVEIDLLPIASVHAGMMVWPQTEAARVLRAWRDLTATLPDDITSAFRLMNVPDVPDLPALLRGRRVVVVDGVALGDQATAEPLLAGLRALHPEIDTFGPTPAAEILRLHQEPEDPLPVVSDTVTLAELPDAAIDDLLAVAGPDTPPRLVSIELRHLGGALARPVPGGGVVSAIPGSYLAFAATIAPTPEAAADGAAAAGMVTDVLAKFGCDRPYLNFVEHATDVSAAFSPTAWRQLVGLKSAFDPDGLILANHPVPTLFQDGRATT